MNGFWLNKYTQATATAALTGIVSGVITYLGVIADNLDAPHLVKIVGLAVMAPFSILVSVLPKITDIITPTVHIVSDQPIAALSLPAGDSHAIDTTEADTVIHTAPPDDRPALRVPRSMK